jgi:hypothetical protein
MGYLKTARSARSTPISVDTPGSHTVSGPLRTNELTNLRTNPAPIVFDGIIIQRDWRSVVAGWPDERWLRWRRTATECLGYLKHPPTAQDIRDADRFAYYVTAPDGTHP